MSVLGYLASIAIPWASKTVLYHYAFRWRHIHATMQTKLIIAGAPILLRGFLPFRLGTFLFFALSVAAGIYFSRKFTDAKLYPDIVGIVGVIELFAAFVIGGFL